MSIHTNMLEGQSPYTQIIRNKSLINETPEIFQKEGFDLKIENYLRLPTVQHLFFKINT